MKRTFLFLVVALCFLSVKAQQTSFVIDCQYPGWLSSYLNPQVATVLTDLKVTGSINEDDLKTIGNLMQNYNLNNRLDLSEVEIDGEIEDYFSGDMFGVTDCSLSYFSLPNTLTNMGKVLSFGEVDTLVVGGESLPDFYIFTHLQTKYSNGYGNPSSIRVKHLIIREGTLTFKSNTGRMTFNASDKNTSLISIKLPESVTYITHLNQFKSLSSINTPQNVEYLGDLKGTNVFHNVETYHLPSKVKVFYDSWINDGYWGVGGTVKELYLPESLETFWLSETYNAQITIHCKSKTVPELSNSSDHGFSKCIIYVPEEYEAVYRNAWKNTTVIGEVYAEDISITIPTLYKGDSCVLKGNVTPSNTTFKNVIWESLNNNILTVDNSGNALCVECGATQLTAYSSDKGVSKTIDVFVYEHTTGVSIDRSYVELEVGDNVKLNAQTLPLELSDNRIAWSSSNPDIVSVDENGNVHSIGKGTCVVKATSVDGNYNAECTILVKQPVATLQLNTKEKILKVGETYTLVAKINPDNADNKNIIWTSENSEIASIKDGIITAHKAGVVKIVATSEDNNNATDFCEVVVTQPVMGVNLNYTEFNLEGIGSTVQLEAIVVPDDATNKEINWKSSNENVCIVSNGTVVAVNSGTSVIIATTVDGGYMAVCTIVVQSDTSIADIKDSSVNYKVYSLYGQRQNALQRGVNIVVFEDGTKAKVFVK